MSMSISYAAWSKWYAVGVKGIPSREISPHSFFPLLVKLQKLQRLAQGLLFARRLCQLTAVSLPAPRLGPAASQIRHQPPCWVHSLWLWSEPSCLPLLLVLVLRAAGVEEKPQLGLSRTPGPDFCTFPPCTAGNGEGEVNQALSLTASEHGIPC